MAFSDDFAASNNPIIQNQIKMALYEFASGIISETPQPTDHTQRLAFATAVLNGTVNWESLILAICAFGSVTTATTDASVSNYVAACWSAFSGA